MANPLDGRGPAPLDVIRAGQQVQAMQPTGNQPLTGLAGYEAGINQGLGGATSALQTGFNQANRQLGLAQQGLAQQGLQNQRMIGSGVNALMRGQRQGLDVINRASDQGVSYLDPYAQGGAQGQQQQLALSGAQGQQAFNSALMDNPATRFLEEQGRKQLLNASAATGGLRGGNVLKDLTRFGQGLAAQDLQNQFNRASTIAGQGLSAAGQQAGIRGQQAGLSSNLIGSTAAGIGNMYGQGAQLGTQLANTSSNLYGQGAGLASGMGQNAANLFAGAGGRLADARMGVGQQLAGQIANTTGNLAELADAQGSGLAGMYDQGAVNIANILSGTGQGVSSGQQTLAQLLANANLGQGSTLAGIQEAIGQAQAGGITGRAAGIRSGVNQVVSGIAGGMGASAGGASLGGSIGQGFQSAFSDIRLKENIDYIGNDGGFNIYSWDWNDKAADLGLHGSSSGVIAQEVEITTPEAITMDKGYKKVNYSMIGVRHG